MKYVKVLGLLAVAAAALMASAGSASATTFTSPAGTTYTGAIKAQAGTTELHGEAYSVTCNNSQMNASLSQHGVGVTVKAIVTTLDFNECSFPVTVIQNGSLEGHATNLSNGTLTASGIKITVHGPFGIDCIYEISNTDLGAFTGGTTARLDIDSALIPFNGHTPFCGSSGEWTGNYIVNTPDTLLLDS